MTTVASAQLHDRDKTLLGIGRTFYIHTHVVLNEDRVNNLTLTTLVATLEDANTYFEPIGVRFEVCEVDTIQNYNFDLLTEDGAESREMINKFQNFDRINLYLVEGIVVDCSFSTQSAVEKGTAAAMFISGGGCLSGSTLAHELGHIFGLYNTNHGNRNELVDGSNCETTGDFICDTPADPYKAPEALQKYITGCEFTSELLDPNGQYYSAQVANMMSPYPCRVGFTYDQFVRMVDSYSNSDPKIW